MGPRAGLYRRTGAAFVPVAETPDIPAVGELVRSVRLERVATSPLT